MLTLSTHDTKRSGDVRARISLLSELPEAWGRAVERWARRNESYKQDGWPDRNAEYLLYQTLVGAWPIEAGRVGAFMQKAAKEAKVHTSWTDPNADYDDALSAFVTAVIADAEFVADLEAFLAEHQLVERGRVTSLAQTALLLTCPGIPDLYQGTELWDFSLVDPDNRRPVDYHRRRALLDALAEGGPETALAMADEGGPKLWLIHRVLAHRRRNPAAYGPGSAYQPLPVTGAKSAHAVAFARSGGLAVVVPRLVATLAGDWAGTEVELPGGGWTNVLTGEEVDGGARRGGPAAAAVPRGGAGQEPVMHEFLVWAPGRRRVDVVLEPGARRVPLRRGGNGWWTGTVDGAGPGCDYAFSLDEGPPRPDPRSAFQPRGIDGPSRVVDHAAFAWSDAGWRGLSLAGAVLQECHVGTFSAEGTFDGAVEHLGHLADLGVDAIELMPVAEFSGDRGWGYDGVDLFAPHHAYGGPDGLKRLVDAAHGHGLGVVLDVVYNHLGPAGNYLPEFGPYFSARHRTNWGDAVNFDGPGSDEVRRFVIDNAVMWLRDYHCDGLRLDAVHAIVGRLRHAHPRGTRPSRSPRWPRTSGGRCSSSPRAT